jgi:PIN domain nuclease of toxin-antitoxin system
MATERYLLDTNAIIRYISNPKKLDRVVHDSIAYGLSFVSIISMQELATLILLNKIEIKGIKKLKDIPEIIQLKGLEIIPLEEKDLFAFYELPFLKDNRDPSDRAIVAHAISRHCTLISSDHKFEKYRPILKLLSI